MGASCLRMFIFLSPIFFLLFCFFFFNDTATTEIYTLSLHDALPIRPVGEQSAFIGGIAAACAGMHAVLAGEPGAVVDVSIQEALATVAITELARAAVSGKSWSRKRLSDGNGATVCI